VLAEADFWSDVEVCEFELSLLARLPLVDDDLPADVALSWPAADDFASERVSAEFAAMLPAAFDEVWSVLPTSLDFFCAAVAEVPDAVSSAATLELDAWLVGAWSSRVLVVEWEASEPDAFELAATLLPLSAPVMSALVDLEDFVDDESLATWFDCAESDCL
jgi:hypothetical protein